VVRRWVLALLAAAGVAAVVVVLLVVLSPWSDEEEAKPTAAAPSSTTVRVMTLNIFYGGDELDLKTGDWCTVRTGCQETFAQVIEAIRESGADVVGLQEPTANTRLVAEELGWDYDERAHVVSRFPVLDPSGADGDFVFVEPEAGRVVAVANTHLPSTPYGPYRVRDGMSREDVLALEKRVRLPALAEQLPALEELAADGIPVFLTGDFNSPSHLDWTEAADDARDDIPFPVEWPVSKGLADAAFTDSYRALNPNPVARPGFTWTPGGPESIRREVHDRIDWVLSAGPARATAGSVLGEDGNENVDLVVEPWPSDHRGFVSTFDVTPAPMPVVVAVESRSVEQPDPLTVRFHGSGDDGERIAVLRPGESFEAALASQPTGRADGTLEFDTGPLAPGTYDAALVDPEGAVVARSGFWLYEAGAEPTVSTSKRSYAAGEPIEAAWTKAPGMKFDWVSVFRARDKPLPPQENCSAGVCGNGTYLLYEYTGAQIEGSTTIDADSNVGYATWPLEPGEYEIRLLLDDGYRSVATSPMFRVVKP
jgi:endonuclease/exonuclease/phosphatase family metal-dependent hydrolase